MLLTSVHKEQLKTDIHDDLLKQVYVTQDISSHKQRLLTLIEGYEQRFDETEVAIFSAPGRTELGGNHTDHQHGNILAASVNLDIIACAAPNHTNIIRIQSEGYPMEEICIDHLDIKPEENNTTAALIRGMVAAVVQKGYTVHGFDAYAMSNVLSGSGLSSSAAYETLIGIILNHFFCEDALTAIEIAKMGQFAENVYFGKPSGLMDQMASSVGNVVQIDFRNPAQPKIEEISFSFATCGHALCIIDSGADHADLTEEYAAITKEMKQIAAHFKQEVLRNVDEVQFFSTLPTLRTQYGDRAVLRAAHFFADDRRAIAEADALKQNNFNRFCTLLKQSGQSSFMYLQNVYSNPQQQAISIALMLTERLLDGQGAFRIHGGGFAGTIQAFVPNAILDTFQDSIEAVFGTGSCHVLQIRPVGGIVLLK